MAERDLTLVMAGRIVAYGLVALLALFAGLGAIRHSGGFACGTWTDEQGAVHDFSVLINTARTQVFGRTLWSFEEPGIHDYLPEAVSLVFLVLVFVPGLIWRRSFIAGAPGRLLMSVFLAGLAVTATSW